MVRRGWTRRGALMGVAALALPAVPLAQADPAAAAATAPTTVWVALAGDALPASMRDVDARALFVDALRAVPAHAADFAPLVSARTRAEAGLEIAPVIRLLSRERGLAQLVIDTRIDMRAYNTRLDCATWTSLVLPVEGEGGWAEPGLYALRSALKRCARDIATLVATELGMRQRGYWQARVDTDRLQAIDFSSRPPEAGQEFLILRETDSALFLAATRDGGMGQLRDDRFIVDKPLVEERRRAAAG